MDATGAQFAHTAVINTDYWSEDSDSEADAQWKEAKKHHTYPKREKDGFIFADDSTANDAKRKAIIASIYNVIDS